MSTSIDQLLSVETLSGLVRTFVDQTDNRTASNLFKSYGKPLVPTGESVAWDEVEFSQGLAPVTGPESPHPRGKRLGLKKRASAMAMIKLYKDLPASHLFLSRAPGTNVQDAELILTSELEDLSNQISNTREFLATGALTGKVTVNPQTIPGSDVHFEIAFGNHEAKAKTAWADPATKIRSVELLHLKQSYKDKAGYQAEIVIAPASIDGVLCQNPDVRELIQTTLGAVVLQNLPLQGVTPAWNLLGGLRLRLTDGVYRPDGGQVTRYFPDDTLVVLPGEPRLNQTLGYAEGRVFVPGGGPFAKAEDATSLVKELRGTYAYAELRTDPMGVRIYAGWYGLFVVLNPAAVMNFSVKP